MIGNGRYTIAVSPPPVSAEDLQKVAAQVTKYAADPSQLHNAFEEAIGDYCGVSHVLSTNSGTSALHLALMSLGVGAGDEVICPDFTFIATCNAVTYCGARPILVDVEHDTWNLCPEMLEKAIIDRRAKGAALKAVIVVHTFGVAAKIDKIKALCDTYNLRLIEDAAGALGTRINGRHVGTWGDASIISFNYNKIITTLGGGALLTNDAKLREKARYLASQSRGTQKEYIHGPDGHNYQINGMAAALGLVQMTHLEGFLKQKTEIYQQYSRALPEALGEAKAMRGAATNKWLSVFELKKENALDCSAFIEEMQKSDIEVRLSWNPMHKQPAMRGVECYLNGTSDALYKRLLVLPSSFALQEKDIEHIVSKIETALLIGIPE